jgi:hypothetical protein
MISPTMGRSNLMSAKIAQPLPQSKNTQSVSKFAQLAGEVAADGEVLLGVGEAGQVAVEVSLWMANS